MIGIKNNFSAAASTRSPSRSTMMENEQETQSSDFFEPPKYITGKHVAAVFERLGFEPLAGMKLFGALCEALARRKSQRQETGRRLKKTAISVMISPTTW